jgi:hypothetical protein
MPADLTDAHLDAIAKLLRETIAADRFPLSPRVRRWQAILDKLEPPAPRPELPPLKPPGTPSMVLAKKRGRRGSIRMKRRICMLGHSAARILLAPS